MRLSWKSKTAITGSNLRTAFSGKGIRGLSEILEQGNVLAPIDDEAGMVIHNDRMAMIAAIIGPKNMDKLIDILCAGIMELSKNA